MWRRLKTVNFQKAILQSVLLLAFSIACSACTFIEGLFNHSSPPPVYFTHTVNTSGETLGIISKWYTGTTKNWKLIAASNPELDIHKIQLGQEVKIPDELIKNREPLPKDVVARILSRIRASKSAAHPITNNKESTKIKHKPENIVSEPLAEPEAPEVSPTPANDPSSEEDEKMNRLIEQLLD